jgi:hypothetical protein
MRFRRPLQPASPLPIASRKLVTPAQRRRARHKHGRKELARVLGYDPGEREAARVYRVRAIREIRRVTREARLPLLGYYVDEEAQFEAAMRRHHLAGQVLIPADLIKITGVS